MLQQTQQLKNIDSLYQLSKAQRHDFFDNLIKNNPASFKSIDPDILNHWIDEAGFSFPSGHSYNAFLFAMILAYATLHNRSRPGLRGLFFVPFVWAFLVALSRVAVGAHSALDVSAGATLGVLTGALFLYIEITRHWLTRK